MIKRETRDSQDDKTMNLPGMQIHWSHLILCISRMLFDQDHRNSHLKNCCTGQMIVAEVVAVAVAVEAAVQSFYHQTTYCLIKKI